MQLKLHAFDLPLKHRFTISRETTTVQPTLIVELEHEGLSGFGEATSNPYYGATIEHMAAVLEAQRGSIESYDGSDPALFWRMMSMLLAGESFAHCALDQAAWDLCGKLEKKPVWELWGLSLDKVPASNFTIGIDTIDTMVAKLREMPGWPIYKIKLGRGQELEIVRALRADLTARGENPVLRVDANCGLTAEQVIPLAEELKTLGVEFIEQPLPADQLEAMRQLLPQSPLPLMADESCQVLADVEKCAGAFHGINIKLVKCGGLTPAKAMIARARELGLAVMVGCMTESTVGISAIAQLLPLLDYVDMDGAALLASDIATGVRVERGICHFSASPGCGVSLDRPSPVVGS
ncbi:Mandelate racemase/muconate lactonizing protein [Pirellula staleyi DSM 6068]|uniref:Dipeptide epimerase n=1 Tax=Pirellula staleyi (strain ATCC 27377 / DSM 6068 / ICPB 4128) TaxID=530564 RepID=D2R4A8_PIRSD|nr:dipeptide epimerase [Pirellula staleyi]ADB15256.1 Mandelate racemase/muconate lactonizing protein [Pirellula staleyi DSM 6068]